MLRTIIVDDEAHMRQTLEKMVNQFCPNLKLVAMADGVRKLLNVDIGISTTGIAGPKGGTKDKPIGLVYIAVSTRKETIVKKFNYKKNDDTKN